MCITQVFNEKEENNDRFHCGSSSLYVGANRDGQHLRRYRVGEEMIVIEIKHDLRKEHEEIPF